VLGSEVGGPAFDDAAEVEPALAKAPAGGRPFDGGARVGWRERDRRAAGYGAEGAVVAGGGECGEDERVEEAVRCLPCGDGEREDGVEPGVGDGFAAVEAGDERGWTEAGEALLLLVEEEAGSEEGEQRALVGDDDEVDAGVHGAEGFELLHGFAPAG